MDTTQVQSLVANATWTDNYLGNEGSKVCDTIPHFRFTYAQGDASNVYSFEVLTDLLPDLLLHEDVVDGFTFFGWFEDMGDAATLESMLTKFLTTIESLDVAGLATFDHESLYGMLYDPDTEEPVGRDDSVPDEVDSLSWGTTILMPAMVRVAIILKPQYWPLLYDKMRSKSERTLEAMVASVHMATATAELNLHE